MQMNGGRYGGRQVLSPRSVAEMQAVQVDRYTATDAAYGLGFSLDTHKGLRRVSHSGDISTFGKPVGHDPQRRRRRRAAGQPRRPALARMDEIVDSLLDRLLDLPPGPPPSRRSSSPTARRGLATPAPSLAIGAAW